MEKCVFWKPVFWKYTVLQSINGGKQTVIKKDTRKTLKTSIVLLPAADNGCCLCQDVGPDEGRGGSKSSSRSRSGVISGRWRTSSSALRLELQLRVSRPLQQPQTPM